MKYYALNQMDWIDEYFRLLMTSNPGAAIDYKATFIPKRLYKYVSLRELRQEKINCFLLDNIWVSSPTSMDDPYDSGFKIDHDTLADNLLIENFSVFNEFVGSTAEKFTDSEETRIKSSKNILNEIFEIIYAKQPIKVEDKTGFFEILKKISDKRYKQITDEFALNLKSSLKISCFTEDNNCLPMWAKYADDHKGFTVEYDFKSLDLLDVRQRLLSPVKYSDELFDVTSFMQDKTGLQGLTAHFAALYKSTHWGFQKEWRLVIPGGIVKEDSNYPVPKPTGLYLGKDISQPDEKVLVAMAKHKKIPVYKMSLSYVARELIPLLMQ